MIKPCVSPCVSITQPGWLTLREELWQGSREEHLEEMRSFLSEPERFAQFVCYSEDGQPVGFVEASVRHDYVNGTSTSPVAFLEGIYVIPEFRRKGFASQLIAAVAAWGRSRGCKELASDTPLDNNVSQAVHRALGFTETERVIYFVKSLGSE
jgi:aminoglycoside 6'-N-acetyltransferase I